MGSGVVFYLWGNTKGYQVIPTPQKQTPDAGQSGCLHSPSPSRVARIYPHYRRFKKEAPWQNT